MRPLYECRHFLISAQMKRKHEVTDILLYRRMLRIIWTEHVSNKYIFKENIYKMYTGIYYVNLLNQKEDFEIGPQ